LACQRLAHTPARVIWGDVLTMADRATQQPLPEQAFDRVIIKSGNHEIPLSQQADLYRSIWRVLKPGGYLINLGFLFDDTDARDEFREITRLKDKLVGMREAVSRRHFLTRDELYARLQEAGFIDIRCAMHFHYAIDSRVAIQNYVPGARGERVHTIIQGRQAQAMSLRRRGLIRFEGDRSQMLAPGEMTMARKSHQATITHDPFTTYPYDFLCSLACYRELQQQIVAHIPPGSHVLDVACGPGHLVHFLADRHASYVGLDISAAFIQTARARYSWQTTVRFDVADMNDMVLERHQYDVIVIANALYLPEAAPEQVLQHAYKALVPGGRVVVSGPASANSFRRAPPQMQAQLAQDGQLEGNEAQWQAIVEANARLLSQQGHYGSAQEMVDCLRRLDFATIITADPTPYYGTGYLVVAEK